MSKLLLAVCTRDRPRMLRACLESIARLEQPTGASLSVLVVDNSSVAGAFERTRSIAATSLGTVPVEVVQESSVGIPFARNRGIDAALAAGAEALVFVDDDQTVPPDWLSTMVRVWREEGAEVVETAIGWEFEGECPYRDLFTRSRHVLDGPPREHRAQGTSTAGVLLDRRLFDEAGLRFDEAFALTGGSDTVLLKLAAARGFRSVLTRETVAVEHCPPEKQTRRWLLRRSFRVGANKSRLQPGRRRRARHLLRGALLCIGGGAQGILLWPVPASSLRALCRSAQGAGMLAGALGFRAREYRSVVGS